MSSGPSSTFLTLLLLAVLNFLAKLRLDAAEYLISLIDSCFKNS